MEHFPHDHAVEVRIKTTIPKYAMLLGIPHLQMISLSYSPADNVEKSQNPQGDYIPKK